jgi:hypothetical protein
VARLGSLGLVSVTLRVLPEKPSSQHALHDPARAWPETNCYVDLWIEVLHALDLDPIACFGFTFSTDFEGDQWTFFKPVFSDIWDLYGVDIQELNIWRPVLEHLRAQIPRKRFVLVEVDSFYLPDLVATDYRKAHAKTTIAVDSLDEENKRLGYFHNAAYASLEGDDYIALLETKPLLPPYTEFAKVDRVVKRGPEELRAMAKRIVAREVARRPKENPISAFRARFATDAAWLAENDLAQFHAYAFATIRQLGACFELSATHLKWLSTDEAHTKAAEQFEIISNGGKALLFKVARTVGGKKKQNFDETLSAMETAWATGMEMVGALYPEPTQT